MLQSNTQYGLNPYCCIPIMHEITIDVIQKSIKTARFIILTSVDVLPSKNQVLRKYC